MSKNHLSMPTPKLKYISPLERKTLQAEIYKRLSNLILHGGLAPGESFTIASIANVLQVSPMPVREAATRLVAEKALAVVSGRSLGVPKQNYKNFRDLKNVRIEIETLALKWAMERLSPKFIAILEEKMKFMVKAEQASSAEKFIEANYNFHFAIYEHANSPILLNIISNLWLRISPYFHLSSRNNHYKISNEQHYKILNAIKANNITKATNALHQDITGTYNMFVFSLFKKEEVSKHS